MERKHKEFEKNKHYAILTKYILSKITELTDSDNSGTLKDANTTGRNYHAIRIRHS